MLMRPVVWRPPAEPSPAEQAVIKVMRRGKLFVFLRLHRHELFSEEFQAELAEAYVDSPGGAAAGAAGPAGAGDAAAGLYPGVR
jgi:hypothetical protein